MKLLPQHSVYVVETVSSKNNIFDFDILDIVRNLADKMTIYQPDTGYLPDIRGYPDPKTGYPKVFEKWTGSGH